MCNLIQYFYIFIHIYSFAFSYSKTRFKLKAQSGVKLEPLAGTLREYVPLSISNESRYRHLNKLHAWEHR